MRIHFLPDVLGYNHQVMDIKQLTLKMNQLVDHHGWYDPASSKTQTPRNLAISLCLEAAEVLDHFQWTEEPKNRQDFEGELADVALYLLQIASVCGIDLEQAILDKIEQNWDRVWQEDIEHESGA
jgi:NTP pyrophosphatase (non-canonical NTP hydrolase)